MPRYDYLSVEGSVVRVDVQKRDWGDHDADAHIAYHEEFFKQVPRRFTVIVDAIRLPYTLGTHIFFFRKLCMFARDQMKDRLVACTIHNPPIALRLLYRALLAGGFVGTETQNKVIFSGNNNKKNN